MTTAPTPNKGELLKALAYLLDPSGVVELRAMHRGSRKRIDSGYFDSAHWPDLADAAISANNEGAAAYITLNPCDPQLLSRYHNRIERFAGATTTDAQIIRRRWLPIDVDPVRPANTSATGAQLRSAAVKASAIRAFLSDQGWPACAAAKSGNGFHLLYALDLPNDEASKTLSEGVLKALASRFDDQTVKVDCSVFNAARIWKLYGTVANKGDHTEAAPWRLAVLDDQFMPPRVVVPREKLLALTGSLEPVRPPRGLDFGNLAGAPKFDLESFMQRHGIEHTRDMHDGSERFKLAVCPFNEEHRSGEAAIFRLASGALAFKCFHNGCTDKGWRAVREHYEGSRPEVAASPRLGPIDPETGEFAAASDRPAAHPLARLVAPSDKPTPPRWIVPGFIAHGVVVIAGAHGIGKTTALLPLAMTCAGLHASDDPLAPPHWRHVIYITEDIEQANRIVAGMVSHGRLGIDRAMVKERLHLVEAIRMEAELFVQVGDTYREGHTRRIGAVALPPLVVVDTKAAVLSMEDENHNSEASKIMALLKQNFAGLPVWLIGHVAKTSMNTNDTSAITVRGSSAMEADANQILYLIKDGADRRFLSRGKTRFEASWEQLEIVPHTAPTTARNEFGQDEAITLRWSTVKPSEMTRSAAKEEAERGKDSALRQKILDLVDIGWRTSLPLNRSGAKSKAGVNANTAARCIERLVAEEWLIEVDVPQSERRNNNQKRVLVNLTADEREAYLRGEGLPVHKQRIPSKGSLRPVPSVSAPPHQQTAAAGS